MKYLIVLLCLFSSFTFADEPKGNYQVTCYMSDFIHKYYPASVIHEDGIYHLIDVFTNVGISKPKYEYVGKFVKVPVNNCVVIYREQ